MRKYFNWRRRETPYPFNLEKEYIDRLRTLRKDGNFRIFARILQEVAEHNADILLRYKDHGDIRERQGFINALRYVIDLPDTIIDSAEEADNARRRTTDTGQTNGPGTGFIGSAYYDLIQRLNPKDRVDS